MPYLAPFDLALLRRWVATGKQTGEGDEPLVVADSGLSGPKTSDSKDLVTSDGALTCY
jgi:hypothetical protein